MTVTIKCDYCGTNLKRCPSQISEHNFCCKEHFKLFLREQNNIYVLKDNYYELNIRYDKNKFKTFLVDIDDIDKLKKHTWHIVNKNRDYLYVATFHNNGKLLMHRFIMNCYDDELKIDHINTYNRLDNRKSNLRICTNYENLQNQKTRIDNKSGYKNIYWHKAQKSWAVSITRYKKRITIGYSKNLEEAVLIRNNYFKERNIHWYN